MGPRDVRGVTLTVKATWCPRIPTAGDGLTTSGVPKLGAARRLASAPLAIDVRTFPGGRGCTHHLAV